MATMFEGRLKPRRTITGWNPFRGRGTRTPPTPTAAPLSAQALDALIQGEIIPRLLSAHPVRPAGDGEEAVTGISWTDAQEFALLPLSLEADELLDHVERHLNRGAPVESIFVDLLAPSARALGEAWEADACDFVDVTMGLWRLQEVMREIAIRVPAVGQALSAPRTVLFSPLPGEQHSFGTLMIEELFARAGWSSEALIEPTRQELLRVLAGRDFDLVGLTVSCDCRSAPLSELITAMRSVSKNPVMQVFVGGRVPNADPSLAARVGADGTAPDARSALALAEIKVPELRMLERIA